MHTLARRAFAAFALLVSLSAHAVESYYAANGTLTPLTSQNAGVRAVGPNVQPPANSTVGATLFPFGPPAGDILMNKNADDISVLVQWDTLGPIGTGLLMPFFGRQYPSLYINSNGNVSFGNGVSSYTPQVFPANLNVPMIAPFWADVDTRGTLSGGIWYRTVVDEPSLATIRDRLRNSMLGMSNFEPTFAQIVTWDHVGYYSAQADRVSTFQVVVVSDGVQSYTMFLYPNKGIWWDYGSANNANNYPCWGFDAGDRVNFANGAGTATSASRDLWFLTNTVPASPGTQVYKLDGGVAPGLNITANRTVSREVYGTVQAGLVPFTLTGTTPQASSLQFNQLNFPNTAAPLTIAGGMALLTNGPDAITHGNLVMDGTSSLVARRAGAISGGTITLKSNSKLLLWTAGATTGGANLAFATSASGPTGGNGGTFDVRGLSTGIGTLNSIATATGLVTNSGGAGTLTIGNELDGIFAGALQLGTMNLVKTGAGTQTLAGATFSGTATVEAGTLAFNGTLSAGGNLTVNAAGTLAGTGSLGRQVVLNGGTVSPAGADVVGTLTASAVTWNAGSALLVDLAVANSDRLAVTGALAKGAGTGPYVIVVNPLAELAHGASYTLATFGSTTFTAADFTVTGLPEGTRAVVTVSGTQLAITIRTAPVITSATTANAVYGNSFNYAITAAPAATSFAATGLPPGLTLNPTSGLISGLPAAVGSFDVALSAANADGTRSGGVTITVASAPATFSFVAASLNQVYNGTPRPVSFNSTPAGISAALLYNGNATAPTAAGSYAVTVTATGPNYSGGATATLTIAKADANVTIGNLARTYTGAPVAVAPVTSPAGLPVDVTYDGSSTPPTAPGSYAVVATVNHANYTGTASATLEISKAPATLTLGQLTATYDGTPHAASAVTNPVGLAVTFTYDGSSVAPTNAGSYAVVATINDARYTGTASGTLVVAKSVASITLGQLAQEYDGTPKSVSATTAPAGLTVTFTYDGNPAAPVNAGSYAVQAAIDDTNYTGAASGTLVVAKATPVITLGQLTHLYDGSPKSAAVTTEPAGLGATFTYDGSATPPVNAGSYTVVASIDAGNYAGTATGTLVIDPAAAVITLDQLAPTYDGTPKAASAATAPAGLAVALTYNGSLTPPVNAGSYAVHAAIADSNYHGAADATLVIGKATATVTLGQLAPTFDASPKPVTATTAPAGLDVQLTYDGSASAPTGAGSYAVTAVINDANYTGGITGTLVIGKASATVTLGALARTYDGSPKAASAVTTPAGLAVDLTYNGAAAAPVGAGSYDVVGTINDANYAGTAAGTLVIDKATATVTLSQLQHVYDGSPKAAVGTTNPAGLTVHLTYNGGASAPINAGSHAVIATVDDPNYAGTASGTLVIERAVPTITLGDLQHIYDGSPKNASAITTPAGLPVTFTYNGGAAAPVNAGNYAVVATVDDANYTGSTSGTLTIEQGTATVTLGQLAQTYDGAPKLATATTSPAGLAVTLTYDEGTTTPVNAGSYAVRAVINDANYVGATTGTLVVAKATATVTLGQLEQVYDGTPRVATATTTPADLEVIIAYDDNVDAPVNAGHYAVVASVHDQNYHGSVTGTLVVHRAVPVIALDGLAQVYDGSPKVATALTVPGGLPVSLTYDGSATPPVNAGSYAVVATVDEANYAGAADGTLVIDKAVAAVTLDQLLQTYSGGSRVVTATTVPAGLTVALAYDGGATPPVNAGAYAVQATVTDANYTGTAAGTLVVGKASASVALSGLEQVYDGTPRTVSAATTPAGLPVSFTYAGNAGAPVNAGTYAVTGTINDPNHAGSGTGTLLVLKALAPVALGQLHQTYDGTPKAVLATTTPAGLAVQLTYNGSPTAPSAVGSYAVVGAVNDANYAGSANGTLVIAKIPVTIALAPLAQAYDGTPRVVTATTVPAGLAVTVTYGGSTVAPTLPGSYAVSAKLTSPSYEGTAEGTLVVTVTALVRHAPALNGGLEGSLQLLSPESFALNGGALVLGDILVPGLPKVQLNGRPTFGGTRDATGAATPTNYTVTLNGNSILGNLVRRVDAPALPAVAAPAAPTGTRSVTVNKAGDPVGAFATLRNLTLNGNAGTVAVPAGNYGNFTVNGSSGLILGVAGATEPAVYGFQQLTLNGNTQVRIVGPVVLKLAGALTLNADVGQEAHPEWLKVQIASGGLTLNGNSSLHGSVDAPNGTVTINGNATLQGRVTADRLTINGNGLLQDPEQ